MNSSNQSLPQQAPTTGTSTTAVASSSTPTSSSNYTEPRLSDKETFERNIDYVGSWIEPSDLNHPEGFLLTS
ncbi:uncharacterized protein N7479_001098 [Penicillium vulpinum]|uniref:Uncharacterized protein n=1 Tax=Penicillium vulpinum TaxID=29845 RepID=A0A1V6REB5_9EURO|nr:uncharacterized protein N7479_001098 [Penicillium vulpinum]KAJ5971180.1 hypothetical protein N7479_001098 [Penicillium vulpinum]OQE00121.1 hypothetical protein PENVUL_c058G10175 [Penicillium vulpinum]